MGFAYLHQAFLGRCWRGSSAWRRADRPRAGGPARRRAGAAHARARRPSRPRPPAARRSRSPRRSRASRPWPPRPRCPAPAGGQAEATARAEEAAAAVAAELATEADPAPAVAAVAVVEPDAPAPEPSFAAGVELSPDALAELWPAVLDEPGVRRRRCWPPCSRAPARRGRRRRADARVARVRRLLQAQGRGPGEQGDDRARRSAR